MKNKRKFQNIYGVEKPILSDTEWENREQEVAASLMNGNISMRNICKATGLLISQVNQVFIKYPDLKIAYRRLNQELKDHVTSNITEIIMDPTHPKCYEASKLFLTKFTTDFDETFEKQEDEGVGIKMGSDADGVLNISFTKKNE